MTTVVESQTPAAPFEVSTTSIAVQGPSDQAVFNQRTRKPLRTQRVILAAILEACRSPSVEHWIMVRARLGYSSFKYHIKKLLEAGMINTLSDEGRTLYCLSDQGIRLLHEMEG